MLCDSPLKQTDRIVALESDEEICVDEMALDRRK
jgi:hypothetical protein